MTAAPARGKGAALRLIVARQKVSSLANPELGAKQICPACQAKFYDLGKRPATCPKCATQFDPEEALKSRRVRARTTTPDYEAEEETPKPAPVEPDGFEDEVDETPEVDEVAAEPVLLHAPERLFVARIDRRRAAAGEKYREGMRQMAPVCDAARQPCDIMVADERERRKTVEETVVAFERPGQFEEIAVLE